MANGPVVWRSGDSPGVPPGSLFYPIYHFRAAETVSVPAFPLSFLPAISGRYPFFPRFKIPERHNSIRLILFMALY
jgi:hypothetical protein